MFPHIDKTTAVRLIFCFLALAIGGLSQAYAEEFTIKDSGLNLQTAAADLAVYDLPTSSEAALDLAVTALVVAAPSNSHQNLFRQCTSAQQKNITLTNKQICWRNKYPCRRLRVAIKTESGSSLKCSMPPLRNKNCGGKEVKECDEENEEPESAQS